MAPGITHSLINADSFQYLKTLPDNFLDSCVTDPPYELNFMAKDWDRSGIATNLEFWKEVFRVLKPGAFLLSFGGTRTFHRLVCAIEDAGFEIRDCIMYGYATGFPKSHDASKAIDKKLGKERTKIRIPAVRVNNPKSIKSGKNVDGGDRPYMEKARQIGYHEVDSDVPVSEEAAKWRGFGTGLKPAFEPICVARKPLDGTLADNLLKWGVGALNIGACRIEPVSAETESSEQLDGRWPANIVFSHSPSCDKTCAEDCPAAALDLQYGWSATKKIEKPSDCGGNTWGGTIQTWRGPRGYSDSGGASRFFFVSKPSSKERDAGLSGANEHPTVKPIKLMRYLVRLATPSDGVCLDPFLGSGTTAIACILEGRNFIGVEKDPKFIKIAENRTNYWKSEQEHDILSFGDE